MTFCLRSSKDPIAVALFQTDRFMLLEYGLSPSELRPGDIARRRSRHPDKLPVFDVRDEIFEPTISLDVTEHPYDRLGRSATTTQTAKAAASLAKTMTGANVPNAKISAALDRIRATSLDINLAGCARYAIDESKAERLFRTLSATTLGKSYFAEGQSLYLVLQTIEANGVYIKKSDNGKLEIGVDIDLDEWAEIGFSLVEAASKGHQIMMKKVEEPAVIAFKAIQLIPDERARFLFRGLEKSILSHRGGEEQDLLKNMELADLSDFQDGENLFVSFGEREK